MSWVNWLIGLGGLGVLALAIMFVAARPAFDVVVGFLKPIASALGDGVAWLGRKSAGWLWEGIKDIFDNWKTIFTVSVLVSGGVLFGLFSTGTITTKECKAIEDLRPDYKFIKRTPQEKAEYLRKHGKSDWRKRIWGN